MSKLEAWFGLSYAGWITIPRCMTKQMPEKWQNELGKLLKQYEETFPNQPDIETRVQLIKNGKFTKECNWLHNYRYPKIKEIDKMRSFSSSDKDKNEPIQMPNM